jgi:von Willebrand factor type A domain
MMRSNLNFPARPIAAALALLAAALFAPCVSAQNHRAGPRTNAPAAGGNRFLMIVDTSASMKSGANEMLRAVEDILRSSASGQMHPGDTLGVWTFNEQLYPGVMPLQTWELENTNEIALRTLEFLKRQPYTHESRLEKALEGMYAVVKSSDIITIFLISNGQNPIQGTPFDQQINALYAESVKEMKRNRKPIVTVLQAKRGQIIKFTVNALPWPVVIPEVPIPIKTAETVTETPAVTPPPAAPPQKAPPPTAAPQTVPPLIVRSNPAPTVVTPTPAPVVATPPPAQIVATPAPPPALKPQSTPIPVAELQKPPEKTPLPPPPPQSVIPGTEGFSPVVPNVAPAPSLVGNRNSSNGRPSIVGFKPRPGPVVIPHVRTNATAKSANGHDLQAMSITINRSKKLLFGAIAGAVVAAAILVLLIYRSRRPTGPSLISRTMSNPPKK